jgi:hypothetical protein
MGISPIFWRETDLSYEGATTGALNRSGELRERSSQASATIPTFIDSNRATITMHYCGSIAGQSPAGLFDARAGALR